jgi:hypothetical protein
LQILYVSCLLPPQQYTHVSWPTTTITFSSTSHAMLPSFLTIPPPHTHRHTNTYTHTRSRNCGHRTLRSRWEPLPPASSANWKTAQCTNTSTCTQADARAHPHAHGTHEACGARKSTLETHLEAGCPALLPPWSLSLSAAV